MSGDVVYFTAPEVAERFRIHVETVTDYAKAGGIGFKAGRRWRFTEADVARLEQLFRAQTAEQIKTTTTGPRLITNRYGTRPA